MGQIGEYSDHRTWIVGFTLTEQEAKTAVNALTRDTCRLVQISTKLEDERSFAMDIEEAGRDHAPLDKKAVVEAGSWFLYSLENAPRYHYEVAEKW